MLSGSTLIKEDKPSEERSSTDSDSSDVGLCTINKHEYQYNSMLCHLFNQEYERAYECATSIIQNATANYGNKVWVIRGVILSLLGRTEEAQFDFQQARENDPVAKSFIEEKKAITLEVFPNQNRLCFYFSYIEFTHVQFPNIVNTKLTK